MTKIIEWPPVGATAWELTDQFPQSRSVGLIEGRSRTSSAMRPRRVARATISGIGQDGNGAGWIRALRRQWAGGPQLTRVTCLPTLWVHSVRGRGFNAPRLEMTDTGTELLFSDSGVPLIMSDGAYALRGVTSTFGGYEIIRVEGLPPNTVVARPSEQIEIYDGVSFTETGFVLTEARSGPDGIARIKTDRDTPFIIADGVVRIGVPEVIVFEAVDIPRAQQTLSSDFTFPFEFREVFPDEYEDGWDYIDPWTAA